MREQQGQISGKDSSKWLSESYEFRRKVLKGGDNVKFHYEGLEIDGPYKNYGIPESQRKLFNENIVKIITRSGKND